MSQTNVIIVSIILTKIFGVLLPDVVHWDIVRKIPSKRKERLNYDYI